MALFVAAIVSFPAILKKKIIGIIIGLMIIFLLNIIRIIALFLTGTYMPSLFKVIHIGVWQVIFILIALAL